MTGLLYPTLDLATGHHVKGTPIRYHHGWIPVAPGEVFTSHEHDSKYTKDSIEIQSDAQQAAEDWADESGLDPNSDTDDRLWKYPSAGDRFHPGTSLSTQAASFWYAYQEPNQYGEQNGILRGPNNAERKRVMSIVDRMFNEAGMRTQKQMSVYRALRADDPKEKAWLGTLEPGKVYSERGMVSTTAYPDLAQGWLALDPKANFKPQRHPTADDTVVEIQLPKGTNIVGGSPQFIETMLHPDTKYRVVKISTETAHPSDPLGDGDELPPFKYRHVIVEAVPNAPNS